jgi:hypothetical protein
LKKHKKSFVDIGGAKLALRNTAYDIESVRQLVLPLLHRKGNGVHSKELVTAAEFEISQYLYATNAGMVEGPDTSFLRHLASKVTCLVTSHTRVW